jgi:hypothetical protein
MGRPTKNVAQNLLFSFEIYRQPYAVIIFIINIIITGSSSSVIILDGQGM